MRGRPSTYDHDRAMAACDAIAEGHKFSTLIEQGIVPKWGTIFRWMNAHEDFREAFAHAREVRAHKWAFEIEEIADEPAPDMAAVTRARLRVDTRKWLLSKLLPKQYGDKVGVEVSGSIDLLALVEAAHAQRDKRDESPLIEGDVQHACDTAEMGEAEQRVKPGSADE